VIEKRRFYLLQDLFLLVLTKGAKYFVRWRVEKDAKK